MLSYVEPCCAILRYVGPMSGSDVGLCQPMLGSMLGYGVLCCAMLVPMLGYGGPMLSYVELCCAILRYVGPMSGSDVGLCRPMLGYVGLWCAMLGYVELCWAWLGRVGFVRIRFSLNFSNFPLAKVPDERKLVASPGFRRQR